MMFALKKLNIKGDLENDGGGFKMTSEESQKIRLSNIELITILENHIEKCKKVPFFKTNERQIASLEIKKSEELLKFLQANDLSDKKTGGKHLADFSHKLDITEKAKGYSKGFSDVLNMLSDTAASIAANPALRLFGI
jgi:hypothetical protein